MNAFKKLVIAVIAVIAFISLPLPMHPAKAMPREGMVYFLESPSTGRVIDVQYASTALGRMIIQHVRHGGLNQRWIFEQQPDGTYIIRTAMETGYVLDLELAGAPSYYRLVQQAESLARTQRWFLNENPDGTVTIRNAAGNFNVDILHPELEDSEIVLDLPSGKGSQIWKMVEASQVPVPMSSSVTEDEGTAAVWILVIVAGAALAAASAGTIRYGRHLFDRQVQALLIVDGTLWYRKKGSSGSESKIDLGALKKPALTISVSKMDEEQDYRIPSSDYYYTILIEAMRARKDFDFLEGYRSRKEGYHPIWLRIKTTQPGILIFGDVICTNHVLKDGDCFESGDYTFRYQEQHEETDQ